MDLTTASQSLSDMPSSSHETDIIMASRSISDLPPEVVIGIFSCLQDHHAITALNLTSRKFYEIWKLNTITITKAVLPRVIGCFDLAQELLVAEGKSPDSRQIETREAVLERSKHLLNNAAVMLKTHANSTSTFDAGKSMPFLRCLYRACICVELVNDRKARDSHLQAATLEELRCLAKDFEWRSFEGLLDGGNHDGLRANWTFETYDAIIAALELKESLSSG